MHQAADADQTEDDAPQHHNGGQQITQEEQSRQENAQEGKPQVAVELSRDHLKHEADTPMA